jgi:hypothetical protein
MMGPGGIVRDLQGVSDFKKLHVWQKAHALSLTIDRMCKRMTGPRYASKESGFQSRDVDFGKHC